MRRRAPQEHVEPFRARIHEPQGHELRDALAAWATSCAAEWRQAIPDMPDGVNDRPADVWEPLLVVADSAGGSWPTRARAACKVLTAIDSTAASLGVQLLEDLRTVFADAEAVFTEDVLDRLHQLDEAPWGDLRGKTLDARGLSYRLGKYEVKPKDVRIGDVIHKGYRAEDLFDPWQRYLSPPPQLSATSATSATKPAAVADVALPQQGEADHDGALALILGDKDLDAEIAEPEQRDGAA